MNQQPFGILNVDKPAALTSRCIVDMAQKIVSPAKAGHAGTLDPLATGVLVVCVGRATRLIDQIQSQPKEYRAKFLLGYRSATDDVTGEVTVTENASRVDIAQIEAVLPKFVGQIEQVPPQFSAVHVGGQRAYKLARRGKKVELAPRTVEVYDIRLVAFDFPAFTLDICCGSGTYIRSIGRDLGNLLGCGAVMNELVRTRVGPFSIEQAIAPQRVTARTLGDLLLPPTTAVGHLHQYTALPEELEHIRCGRPFISTGGHSPSDGETIAVLAPGGHLAALANYSRRDHTLTAKPVFVDSSQSAVQTSDERLS